MGETTPGGGWGGGEEGPWQLRDKRSEAGLLSAFKILADFVSALCDSKFLHLPSTELPTLFVNGCRTPAYMSAMETMFI